MGVRFSVDYSVKESGRNAPTYDIKNDLNGESSLKDFFTFTQRALITTYITVLKEEQAKGFTKTPRTKVDGSFFKPVVRVLPLGKIIAFDTQNVLEILNDIYTGILGRSIVKTGNYKTSNVVLFRDKLIAVGLNSLEVWIKANSEKQFKQGDKFDFINLAPYARKLENRGLGISIPKGTRTNKRRKGKLKSGQVVSKPNGAYFKTAANIKRKYKQASGKVKFQWRTAPQAAGVFNQGRFLIHFQTEGKGHGRPYIYPSVQYRIDTRGT